MNAISESTTPTTVQHEGSERSEGNSSAFVKQQLITYMGNKRKLLPHIHALIFEVADILGKETISFADAFSGSGVVSRMALQSGKLHTLLANDNALYSHIANMCYLRPPDQETMREINDLVRQANTYLQHAIESTSTSTSTSTCVLVPETYTPFISKHWAPRDDNNIQPGERCYFTHDNAIRIDILQTFIQSSAVREQLKPYLLAPLLAECSVHANTNGQFAAFYKDQFGVGKFGGKKEIDIPRICGQIQLRAPVFPPGSSTGSHKYPTTICTNHDVFKWAFDLSGGSSEEPHTHIDLLYLDPPYNKHPYSIYYFLLDIIARWKLDLDVPDSYRGQPKTWLRSPFNSTTGAAAAIRNVIRLAPASFVALSYYDAGIVSIDEIDQMMASMGDFRKIPVKHDTYNRLHGLGDKWRHKESKESKESAEEHEHVDAEETGGAKEYLWLLKKHET